jgi:anaphase-promoting complex subunit 10
VSHGVDGLFDRRIDTFWQSDGALPHAIQGQFDQRMHLLEVQLYVSYDEDESYTPQSVVVRAGTHAHDLQEVYACVFEQPQGWQRILFLAPRDDPPRLQENVWLADTNVDAFLIQICLCANHQHGKDARVRGMRIVAAATPPMHASLEPTLCR